MASLPTVIAEEVYHWGNLATDPVSRFGDSLEGPLLSCSTSDEAHEAWHQIARLGGFASWTLSLVGGFRLLDFHALKPAAKRKLLGQARAGGFLAAEDKQVWKRSFDYEDEDGQVTRRYSLHSTYFAARAECDGSSDRARIHRVKVPAATDTLSLYWMGRSKCRGGRIDDGIVEDAAICACLDTLPEYKAVAGIFWDETFDPDNLSAPRAGLFQRVLVGAKKQSAGAILEDKHDDDPIVPRFASV